MTLRRVGGLVRRMLAALWVGCWLAALLVGLPWGLVALFGLPVPHHPPQQPYLREWITVAVLLVAWLVWLVLLTLVGLEVRAALRRLRMPHLRLASPPQGLLSGLVGAAVVALTTAASRGTAPAAPPPAVAAPAPPPPGLPGAVLDTAQPDGTADRMDPAVGSLTSGPSGEQVAAAFGTGPAAATVDAAVYGRRPWRAEGVELPGGGWVDRDTAAAVAAAAALLWLRRRRRYLPRPPSRSAREDADLAALPNTVAAILQAGQDVEPDAPDTPSPDADGGGALGPAPPTPAAGITPPAAGAAGGGAGWDRPLSVADLPPGGVGVVGPAAADALRGILTTALLSNDSDQTVLVSTTAADLDTLLGGGPVGDRPPAGMAVYDSIEQLLAAAETHLLNNPTSGPAGPGPRPAPTRPDAATAQPAPPARLLLVTSCPAQVEAARRLALLLTHPAAGPGLTAVLLGRWPYGTTWQVEPGGHIHPDPPPPPGHRQPPPGQRRICVLPAAAATDLLALLTPTHPDNPHPVNAPTQQPAGDAAPRPRVASTIATNTARQPRAPTERGGTAPPVVGQEAPLRLRLLGGVDLHLPEEPDRPLHLTRAAAVQVLAYLAIHPNGAGSAQLAEAIWPGLRPHPTARLYTAASALRAEVARATGIEILIRAGDRYQLHPRRLQVDLWALSAAVDLAATTPDRHTRAATLRQVTALYTGEVAAGHPWPWLTPARETVRRHVIDAYTTLAADADPRTATDLLHRALLVDPLNEDLYRQAMRAFAAAGQPDRAPVLLAQLTRRLAQIGEKPNHDTRTLAEQLRHHPRNR